MPVKSFRFSWSINTNCNYKCKYCLIPFYHKVLTKRIPLPKPEQWLTAWHNIYNKYGEVFIEISGGEPTIYPDFYILIKEISRFHKLAISTNLSFNPNLFVNNFDPKRIFIYPSFHPQQVNLDSFLKKVLKLKSHGFNIPGIFSVAYPSEIKNLSLYKHILNDFSLPLIVQPFKGYYKFKNYPNNYTKKEISNLIRLTNSCFTKLFPNNKNKLCSAGVNYARVNFLGNVYRCAPEQDKNLNKSILGNFFDDNFALKNEPVKCKYKTCYCSNEHNLQI